jgi:hypothetical protein
VLVGLFLFQKRREPRGSIPRVPLPPMLILPKREKGTERVMMSGVMLRMTMTFSGFEGMSLLVMLGWW